MTKLSIVSGGQSGVDRAALDAAIAKRIPYLGWCPQGGWAEDYPIPPGVMAMYPRLKETPSSAPEQRTAWNVRDSHATLIILPGSTTEISKGTAFACLCAEIVFLREIHVVNLGSPDNLGPTARWLRSSMQSLRPESFCLNVAGPRESEGPGIYVASRSFLAELLGAFET